MSCVLLGLWLGSSGSFASKSSNTASTERDSQCIPGARDTGARIFTYHRCSEAQGGVAGRGSGDRLGKAVRDRRAQRAPTLAETQIREDRSENSQPSEILKNISDDHHHMFLVASCGLWRVYSAPGTPRSSISVCWNVPDKLSYLHCGEFQILFDCLNSPYKIHKH